jgi:dATP pyrophosphohydrolase
MNSDIEPLKQKVQVWIRSRMEEQDLFLLLKTIPERGEFWQPVTGSVEAGEDVEEAAVRELHEETGLRPLKPLRSISSPFDFENHGKQVREFPFLAEVDSSKCECVILDPHEHDGYEWASAKRALQLLKHESNARVLRDLVQSDERK